MKKIISLLLCAIFLISCSSSNDDMDEVPLLNLDLLYGQWFDINKCQPQNNLTLNNNGGYIRVQSGNLDCETNEYSTSQTTGTFNIDEEDISFIEESFEIIIEGTDTGTGVGDFNLLVYSKIIELTENSLVIERKFDDGTFEYFNNWLFTK